MRSRLTLVLLAMVLVTGCAGLSLPKAVSLPNVGLGCVRTAPTPLHGAGSKLVDASGSEVRLTGVNWSGMETSTFAPHGLWARKLDDMLGQIASSGFNAIRLPFTNQLFDPGSVPNGIDLYQNADLKGLNGLALMDRVVERARCYGLRIILDRHRPSVGGAPPPLWYTAQVPDERWIADWVSLARHYAGNPTVVGADLDNEPHGGVTWGTGNIRTDWRLAAERAGNAILSANGDWLIMVEGTDVYRGDSYRWGGDLLGAGDYPVRLSNPAKLVYAPHDYGLATGEAPWLQASTYPANLPGVWERHWAYLQIRGIAPVVVGEFGGRSVGDDRDGVWQRTLVDYLKQHGIGYTYWEWGADSDSDGTGGLLMNDWKTINRPKLDLLATYQWPRPL